MSALPQPWLEDWPARDLEAVPACPVCGGTQRVVWLDGVVDNTFRTSPGRWRLWRCAGCEAGYLDPRPSQASIHRAYASYYTHGVAPAPESAARRLHRRLSNGYTNARFGTAEAPASALGRLLIGGVPYLRRFADREFRHLPPLPAGGGAVLDVGCGDGAFLARARGCGWQVLGLEPDPQAAQVARQQGVDVIVGGIDALADRAACFDVITLAHVIEHVPDPAATLRACHRLLKPGGTLWLETPQAQSEGLREFGRDWRGLETPRHLVLFTPRTLERAIRDAGFEAPTHPPTPSVRRWMFQRSLAIREGRWPDDTRPLGWRWLLRCWLADWRGHPAGTHGEFLTFTARKPG